MSEVVHVFIYGLLWTVVALISLAIVGVVIGAIVMFLVVGAEMSHRERIQFLKGVGWLALVFAGVYAIGLAARHFSLPGYPL